MVILATIGALMRASRQRNCSFRQMGKPVCLAEALLLLLPIAFRHH
jgi:hypothetical protein